MERASDEFIVDVQEETKRDDVEYIELINPYGFIYITTNMVNGKRYLGQARFKRKSWNHYLGSGAVFKKSVKLYQKENFKRDIICICYSEEELNNTEYELSVFLNVVEDSNWYNLVYGGGGIPGLCGDKNPMYGVSPKERMDEDTYQRWRQYFKNTPKGEDHPWFGISLKDRLGEDGYLQWRESQRNTNRAGENNPMYGISPKNRMDEETYNQWIVHQRVNSPRGENHPMYGKKGIHSAKFYPVYCIELDEIFWGPTNVYQKYNISAGNVTNCCMGKIKSAGKHPETGAKLQWLYVDDKVIENGVIIKGAITKGYITHERLDRYLQSLN